MTDLLEEGIIIFWNGTFGFINDARGASIFFHFSGIVQQKNISLNLLDEVSFVRTIVKKGRHQGKIIAEQVTQIKAYDLSNYKRHIGVLTNWRGKSGFIESPQQDKKVLLYNTRMFFKDDDFKNGDYVVFHQVKSSKDEDQLFALFAYSMTRETNVDFLQQQYQDSQQSSIKDYINQLLDSKRGLSTEEKFIEKLKLLSPVNNLVSFSKLCELIDAYKELSHRPSYEELKPYCTEKFMILLWEKEIIDEYDLELVKRYFFNTKALIKRSIINRLKKEDKRTVLQFYYDLLLQHNKLNRLNNDCKTLLDLVYRNKETRDTELYPIVKDHFTSTFKPESIIELWLKGYLDALPRKFIKEHFDLNNGKLVNWLVEKEKKDGGDVLINLFQDYFGELKKNKELFAEEFSILVNRLFLFENSYEDKYSQILVQLNAILDKKSQLLLWIYGVTISFDRTAYFNLHSQDLNPYEKIRFFLALWVENDENEDGGLIDTDRKWIKQLWSSNIVSQVELEAYIKASTWKSLVHPTQIVGYGGVVSSFLEDITNLIQYFKVKVIDKDFLAELIFDTVSYCHVIHLRLWLYGYVGKEKFDYIGFRQCYKQLTNHEQGIFKKKGSEIKIEEDVTEIEINDVAPCENILVLEPSYKIYGAVLSNIYFERKKLSLRKENGEFTESYNEPLAFPGFNRVPSSSSLNKMPIEIKLRADNHIEYIKGLEEIHQKVHADEIGKYLGDITIKDGTGEEENKAYVEDWEMRKQVIKYLNDNQIIGTDTLPVFESRARKKGSPDEVKEEELTKLFSLEARGGIVIVWENIDLTEDRATYVFKSTLLNHDKQLKKLKDSISTLGHLRTALSTRQKIPLIEAFRNNLGLLGAIKKSRGSKMSFDEWKIKLKDLMKRPVPLQPSQQEKILLQDWDPKIGITVSINRDAKIIDDSEIDIIDIDLGGNNASDSPPKKKKTTKKKKANKKKAIYDILKQFNDQFSELINFDDDGSNK